MEDQTVNAPMVKAVSVLAATGFTSWSELASAAAFLYTVILISEWCWKKFLRDWIKSRGQNVE